MQTGRWADAAPRQLQDGIHPRARRVDDHPGGHLPALAREGVMEVDAAGHAVADHNEVHGRVIADVGASLSGLPQ